MAKVDELREKYSKVTKATFDKLVKGDTTPTKKYLEYMLKMWTLKMEGRETISSANILISEVKRFDELLPYNQHIKDIYDRKLLIFDNLKKLNDELSVIKDEKFFNKKEHANIIFEDDDYIFVEPKTHKGSLKYGANTKWCTASKSNPQTFISYTKKSFLVYLIDKKNSKGTTSKVAFYSQGSNNPLSGEIIMYNQNDSCITEHNLLSCGWSMNLVADFILKYRIYHLEWKQTKDSRDEVNRVINIMKGLDINSLSKHMEILKNAGSSEFDGVKTIIDDFVKKIENNVSKLKI
jgi:hypothetical protein